MSSVPPKKTLLLLLKKTFFQHLKKNDEEHPICTRLLLATVLSRSGEFFDIQLFCGFPFKQLDFISRSP